MSGIKDLKAMFRKNKPKPTTPVQTPVFSSPLLLGRIPYEILNLIMRYLSRRDHARLASVCENWREVADLDKSWKDRYFRDFTKPGGFVMAFKEENILDWKRAYREDTNPAFPHVRYLACPAVPYHEKYKELEMYYRDESRRNYEGMFQRLRGIYKRSILQNGRLAWNAKSHGMSMDVEACLMLRGWVLAGFSMAVIMGEAGCVVM